MFFFQQIFPAVLRALKSRVSRISLTQELSYHIRSNRAMLEHQQFDLVVKLLNCALQVGSVISLDQRGSLVVEHSLRVWEVQVQFPEESNQRFQIGSRSFLVKCSTYKG